MSSDQGYGFESKEVVTESAVLRRWLGEKVWVGRKGPES